METLLDHLRNQFPTAGRETLKRMVAAGRVKIDGVVATRLSQTVEPGKKVFVSSKAPSAPVPGIAPLKIVFEDEDLLVVDKPAGLLTSTVPRERRPTALAIVRAYVMARQPRGRVGLIHRLDRDASGVLIFSKSSEAYDALKTQFFKHTVEREYRAVVYGTVKPKAGRIESRLIERKDGSVHSTGQHAKGQRAISDYEVISSEAGRSILRVRLLTGRKHQIRVHLSERGWPIVGDSVYGREGDVGPLQLGAVKLTIDHPRTGRRMIFTVK